MGHFKQVFQIVLDKNVSLKTSSFFKLTWLDVGWNKRSFKNINITVQLVDESYNFEQYKLPK